MSVIAAEYLKLRHWRTAWILVSLPALIAVAYFLASIIDSQGVGRWLAPQLAVDMDGTLLFLIAQFGAIAAFLLGALFGAGEHSWRTVETITIQGPSRQSLMRGKAMTLAIVFTVLTSAMWVLTIAGGALAGAQAGLSPTWPTIGQLAYTTASAAVIMITWSSFGLLLGEVFRNPGLAVGAGLIHMLFIEQILMRLPETTPVGALKPLLLLENTWTSARHEASLSAEPLGASLLLAVEAVAFISLAVWIRSSRDIT